MYVPKPGEKVYVLTRTGRGGYTRLQYFPATADGLDKAMREWRRNGNRRTGQRYGQIDLVTAPAKA